MIVDSLESNPKVQAAGEVASAQLMNVSSSSSTMETFKPDSASSKRESDKVIKPDKKTKAAPKQEPPSLPPPPPPKEALPEPAKAPSKKPEQSIHEKMSKKSTASSSTDKYEGISKKVKKDAGQLKSDPRSIQKGVEKIEGVKTLKFWERQNLGTLKEQAEARGYRFTDLETKGGIVPGSGSMIKQKKF